MKTDIPLKRLTQRCPTDLLPLIGAPTAEVLGIVSVELPTTTTSLDTLLRLRKPGGSPYYHLIEWQGYRDERFLWRVLGYLSWLGQHYDERPIKVTLVYLKPNDDVGTMLDQCDDPRTREGRTSGGAVPDPPASHHRSRADAFSGDCANAPRPSADRE